MNDLVKEAAAGLDVKQFKLMNGETVLGIVKEETRTTLIIESPIELLESYEDDTYRYGFKHWFEFSVNDEATLFKSSLVALSDINNNIKESYLKVIISNGTDEISNESISDNNTSNMTCH
jgi:hypothetical protein|tara:strand:- start:120 stop:479 length:360 start_codon:yes stop_codon:yes gene_type:complete